MNEGIDTKHSLQNEGMIRNIPYPFKAATRARNSKYTVQEKVTQYKKLRVNPFRNCL